MQSARQIKLQMKIAGEQRQVILELESLVKDIERCERTITDLQNELEKVNAKFQGKTTTRENIEYLTDLLNCAKKKLVWEKNIASLRKRAPQVLEKMADLINDPNAPPDEATKEGIIRSLGAVQAAMERLQNVKVD